MGIWIPQPRLQEGEVVRWQASAGRSLNRWITSGGQLLVTDRRVLFQPNRFDVFTGKRPWECLLDSVTGLEIVDRDLITPAGGPRKRLGINTAFGRELFVVNSLEDKVTELGEFLS